VEERVFTSAIGCDDPDGVPAFSPTVRELGENSLWAGRIKVGNREENFQFGLRLSPRGTAEVSPLLMLFNPKYWAQHLLIQW